MPKLVLGVLTLLAAGAIVLGLVLAPTTADLTVHNGAGEILLAPSLTAYYRSVNPPETLRIAYTAPDRLEETLLSAGPGSKPVRSRTIKGSRAAAALKPFDQLLTITGFSPVGSHFVAVAPFATFVPSSEAQLVSGSVTFVTTVRGGYTVGVTERSRVKTPNGTQRGTFVYTVTSVDGQPVTGS